MLAGAVLATTLKMDPAVAATASPMAVEITKSFLKNVADTMSVFTAMFAKRRGIPIEQAQAEVKALLEDESTEERVRRVIRCALETPHKDSIEALANLLTMYVDPKNSDAFFRSMAKLLSDSDQQDIADLRATVAASALDSGGFPERTIVTADRSGTFAPLTVAPKEKAVTETIQEGNGRSGRNKTTTVFLDTTGDGKRPVTGVTYERAAMVVQRLGVVGIGTLRTEAKVESVAVPDTIMRRLAVILGTETPST